MPDDSWRRDLRELVTDYLSDLGRSQEAIRRLQAAPIAQVLARAGARVHVNGTAENIAEIAAREVDALLAGRRSGSGRFRRSAAPWCRNASRARYPALHRPAFVALVDENGKIRHGQRLGSGRDLRRDPARGLPRHLGFGRPCGSGAHGLFMRTWNVGLAYGNGISQVNSVGGR